MQMRIKMWLERRNGNKGGTLVCSKCKTPGHFALFAGGRCRRCYTPRKINPKYTATAGGRAIDPRIQTPETLALQRCCEEMMKEFDLNTPYAFSRAIHVSSTSFSQWMKGHYGTKGQAGMIAKVTPALDRFIRVNGKDAEVA